MSDNGVPVEYRLQHQEKGFPWCDTCRMPAVFSEFFGNLHSTPEHPFGLPRQLDRSDHEVTMRQWWGPGLSHQEQRAGREAAADYIEKEASRGDESSEDLLKLAFLVRLEGLT